MGGDLLGQRSVPGVAVGVVTEPLDERGDACTLGAGESLDAVTVGTDRDDRGAVGRVSRRVDQGLEVGAGAGDEDDEASALTSRTLGHGRHDSATPTHRAHRPGP